MTGLNTSASFHGEDALEDAANFSCEICGKPCERKRRRDGSWFHYRLCRRCRRQNARLKPGKGTVPSPITDQRLNLLTMALYDRLWQLKTRGLLAPMKTPVRERLEMLLRVLQED
jgi:hypothetical protein